MQRKLPVLIRRVNFKAWVAIRAQVVGCSLLRIVRVENLPFPIQLQDVREDGIDLFNCAWLATIQVEVIHTFESVLRTARHEVGESSQCSAEGVTQVRHRL